MAEGDLRNLKYPFGTGTTIAASGSTTKPDSGFINVDGADFSWLTVSYTGDSSEITAVVYGYADENDNGDPIATMVLNSSNKHGKILVEGGLPFIKLKITNSDSVNAAVVKAILNVVRD